MGRGKEAQPTVLHVMYNTVYDCHVHSADSPSVPRQPVMICTVVSPVLLRQVIVFERGDLLFIFNFHPSETYEGYGQKKKKATTYEGVRRTDKRTPL